MSAHIADVRNLKACDEACRPSDDANRSRESGRRSSRRSVSAESGRSLERAVPERPGIPERRAAASHGIPSKSRSAGRRGRKTSFATGYRDGRAPFVVLRSAQKLPGRRAIVPADAAQVHPAPPIPSVKIAFAPRGGSCKMPASGRANPAPTDCEALSESRSARSAARAIRRSSGRNACAHLGEA